MGRNKSRSVLTLLGIVIGIASIITVMSVGEGAKNLILGQIQGLGSKTIAVIPGRQPRGPTDIAALLLDSLKEKDLNSLRKRENVPYAADVMPVVFGPIRLAYEGETYQTTMLGGGSTDTNDILGKVFDVYPEKGRFFSVEEVNSKASVATIGDKIRRELFGFTDPLGKILKVNGLNFRVVGVLAPKGQVSFFNFDDTLLVPYTTAQQYILGRKHFDRIIVVAKSDETVETTVGDIAVTLRINHGITDPSKDDFFIQTQADLADRLGTVTSILTILLTSVAGISLLVGGIGIMNIMLVSVTERTREIGLRKAIGATNRNILTQFLLEAVMLTIGGGVIGIILGLSLSFSASFILGQYLGVDWGFTIPLNAIIIGLGLSAFVGIVFGTYPARQASLKSQIEALRYE